MSEAREKALHLVVKLRALANDERAPEGERAAARSRLAAVCEKHGISQTEAPKPPPTKRTPPQGDFNSEWLMDILRQQRRKQEAEDVRRRQAAREKAARDFEERMRDKDDLGRPKDDPWADTRTHAQRQADLNASFGKNYAWFRENFPRSGPMPPPKQQTCNPKLEFFDGGGIARRRNKDKQPCANCGGMLWPGEGAEFPLTVGNVIKLAYACCDKVPGPRRKKSAQSD